MMLTKGAHWQQEMVKNQLAEINGVRIEDLEVLNKFDTDTIDKVLLVLLEWACCGQGDSGIMMGRQLVSKIPKDCLEKHIVGVVKKGFEYEDDWNFRRLLEVVTETIPGCKEEILRINADSSDPNIIEVIEDYS